MKQVDLFLLFEKKITWFNFLNQVQKKKMVFFVIFFVIFFFFKSSMASFLEYILDSIYVFKLVDFNFLGLHRLVRFLLRN